MQTDNSTFLTIGKTARRYGRCNRTIDRWLKDDPQFPHPVEICGRRYWRLDDLQAWERALASGKALEGKNVGVGHAPT
jgi:predicted DNA-binding transcriptional regulator AlpA